MATEDWETTKLIYGEHLRTISNYDSDNDPGQRVVFLNVSMAGSVYCQWINHVSQRKNDDIVGKLRFWMMEEDEVVFQISFSVDTEKDEYERVEIAMDSPFPDSIPPKYKLTWIDWVERRACDILEEEQLSYSVCAFVENGAVDFFPTLYQDGDERHLRVLPYDSNDENKVNQSELPESFIVATFTPYIMGYERFDRDDDSGQMMLSQAHTLSQIQAKYIYPLLVLWRDWFPVHCKICFETVDASEAATITCGHSFCRECLTMYLCGKAKDEVSEYQTSNPFKCPTCSRGMLIIGCVKQFLPPDLMDKVRAWIKDVKNPRCHSLPNCLKRTCNGDMRRVAVDSDFVYCEACNGRWCELCLKRAPEGDEHKQCNLGDCVEFCRRYLACTDEESRERCKTKWPWIKVYARSRMQNESITQWVQSNGQVCPGCKSGIERSEGCFHISCLCGTHFCYLCGEEIFAPFYGTHHCWERATGDT